jgi:membrane protease YdiL (CAAX protease family)
MSAVNQSNILPKERVLRGVFWFLGLTALFSIIIDYFLIEHGLRRHYMALLMWSPGLAALLTCKMNGISTQSLGWQWGRSRWVALGYGLPILYGLIAYGIIWGAGLGGFIDARFIKEVSYFLGLTGWSETATVVFGIIMFGTVGMVWHIASSLGEELGWRGFLTPQLMRRYTFPVASLITGLIWAIWHIPLIFMTKYNAGPVDLEIQVLNFTLLSIGFSLIMTYLRLKSSSIWPVTLMHASHNLYVLSIFHPMTVQYKETWRYANEFGFVVPLIVLLFGLYFWRRAVQDGLNGPLNT